MNYLSKNQQTASADAHTTDTVSTMPEPYVTADEVATFLKATRRQVLEMSRKGLIPAHPASFSSRRKMWRYKLSEVDQAIACGVRKPASPVKK